jgi:hypothetical protein
MGFQSGQLILELSPNTAASEMFDYNGLKKWTEHLRYAQTDQVTRPIALTNFAHLAGGVFTISEHPDFSLAAEDIRSPATFTFFLWKSAGYSGRSGRSFSEKGLPDFIFQLTISGDRPSS